MVGLHGKSHLEKDDDWGYPYVLGNHHLESMVRERQLIEKTPRGDKHLPSRAADKHLPDILEPHPHTELPK